MKKQTLRKTLARTAGALLIAASLQGASMAGETGDSTMAKFEPDASFMSAPESSPDQMEETKGMTNWNLVYKLVKLNMKIYGNLGWQIGRLEAQKKYGVDIGPYPGVKNVTLDWFNKKFNKRK